MHIPAPLRTTYAQRTIRVNWKIIDSNFFGKLTIDGNLTHEIKSTRKNESELGDIFTYLFTDQ